MGTTPIFSTGRRKWGVDSGNTTHLLWTGRTSPRRSRLGKRDYRALLIRTEVLLTHLLKWRYQREKRSHGWASTILTQRNRIQLIVADSPGFKGRIEREMLKVYADAIRKASVETAIPDNNFPAECPWTFEAATLEPLDL